VFKRGRRLWRRSRKKEEKIGEHFKENLFNLRERKFLSFKEKCSAWRRKNRQRKKKTAHPLPRKRSCVVLTDKRKKREHMYPRQRLSGGKRGRGCRLRERMWNSLLPLRKVKCPSFLKDRKKGKHIGVAETDSKGGPRKKEGRILISERDSFHSHRRRKRSLIEEKGGIVREKREKKRKQDRIAEVTHTSQNGSTHFRPAPGRTDYRPVGKGKEFKQRKKAT